MQAQAPALAEPVSEEVTGFPLVAGAFRPRAQSQRALRRAEWDARKQTERPKSRRRDFRPVSVPAIPVSGLGVCDGCGGLTPLCCCDQKARRQEVLEQALLRPVAVLARVKGEPMPSGDVAVLVVPATASESAKHVARAAAHIATIRLHSGSTLAFALDKVALGRDQVKRTLEVLGVVLDRKTVANALDELDYLGVLPRVGQLNSWWDTEDGMTKKGAYIYALTVRLGKLGQRALGAVRRLAGRSDPLHAAVRGMGLPRRVQGALSKAIQTAQTGERNNFGRWVVDRCIDAGLNEDQTMKVMRIYVSNVDQTGHRYTLRDAERTTRSRWKRRGARGWNRLTDPYHEVS